MRGFAARVGWVVVGSLRMTKGTPLIVVEPTSQTGRGLATPVMIELASPFHPTRQWSAPSERTALGAWAVVAVEGTIVGNGVESGRSGRGPHYRSFGMGCAPRIVLERRRLCRRHVGTFHTSSCVWQPLRQVPSERTMSSEAMKSRSRRRGERAMDLGLQGKHAIVTGGSRGIGKAAERRYDV